MKTSNNVVSLAAEAGICGIYTDCQVATPLRHTLPTILPHLHTPMIHLKWKEENYELWDITGW